MDVRRLGAEEWEVWKAVRLRALAEAPEAFGSTFSRESAYSDQDWMERTALLAAGTERVMFLASVGADVAGCGGAFIEADGTPSVVAMWVDPACRRRGVGRGLLVAIEDWARGRGKERMSLVVLDGNRAAESLYLEAGFSFTGATYALDRGGSSVTGRVMVRDWGQGRAANL